MTKPVFECQMCGSCCEGKGGIIVGPKDLERICSFLRVDAATFAERYGVTHNGKLKIRTGGDSYCIFFAQGRGCTVHEGKPDICRAWPFFRGNLVDPESLHMAKEFCPGIASDVSHADFAAAGRRYLQAHDLYAHDATCEANALIDK